MPSWGAAVLRPYQERCSATLAVRGGGGRGVQKNVQVVGMDGAEESVFALDVALADQIDERVFEAEGAFLFGESNFLVKMLQGVAPDVMASAVAYKEQLGCGNAA